ncbi:hypothetical protein BH09BAC1_BH09BAC1_25450 [soil metagenome]
MLHRLISIEGNIGAGKTTLATLIANATGRQLVLERFEENPFLAAFYEHPEQHALNTELFFLSQRFNQWIELPDVPIVADYSFAKSLYFAEVTLKGEEFDNFNEIYQGLKLIVRPPDLILYLYRTTEQLSQHITQRGRVYEQEIPETYLQQIQDNYLRHLRLLSNQAIVLIDAQNRDFLQKPEDLQWLLELLQQELPLGITAVH